MRKIKNIYKILAFLLLLCTLLSSCGQLNEGTLPDERETEAQTDGTVKDPEKEEEFTVTLMYNGKAFDQFPAEPIMARWTKEGEYHEAAFDTGTAEAKITGLDGDYQVTLSSLPDGFTYNPNVHVSGNNNKNIIIELFKYYKPRTGGGKWNSGIEISKLQVYRAEIKNSKGEVYFYFKPSESGTYTIESWVDITDNQINPVLVQYYGNPITGVHSPQTHDAGGISSTYTKNFKFTIQVDSRYIGNVYIFSVKAETELDYPVTVDFAVQLDGGFSENWATKQLIIPQATLEKVEFPTDGRPKNIVYPEVKTENGGWRFDGSMYAINEKDGYYHKLDENGKPNGELLFANITSFHRFVADEDPKTFANIESAGNTALTLSNGTENYRYFITGTSPTENYFCGYVVSPYREVCPCTEGDHACPGVCVEGCTLCLPNCTQVSQEIYNQMAKTGFNGYADFANSDGMCPVTEELKDFLQKFSISNRYYYDGNGWVETHPTISIDALEEDQWLFACAYYQGFTNLSE